MEQNTVVTPPLTATQEGDQAYFKNTNGNDIRKEQKEITIQIVERLLIRGIKSAKDIQDTLKENNPPIIATTRSIYRYMAVIKRRNHEEIRRKIGINETVEQLAHTLKKTIEEVTRELWKQHHSPTIMEIECPQCKRHQMIRSKFGAMVKIAALKEIREAGHEWLKTMQSLGLTYQAPTQVQTIGADGKPVDPSLNVNVQNLELNQVFNAFIKSRYQDPVGVGKEELPQKAKNV